LQPPGGSALADNLRHVGQLLSRCVAEAAVLAVPIPGAIHHAVADVERWASVVRRHEGMPRR
jgi:hypothetical protein